MDKYELLDSKAQPGAFSTYDMEAIVPEIEKLVAGDIYLEVGVDKGKSLSVAKMVAKEGVQVCGVDINFPPGLDSYLKNNPTVNFSQGDSFEVAKGFNGEISVLLIDGDHTYGGCKTDIEAWFPHMKADGVMFFHDHDESSPGVVWAASEFYYTHNFKKYRMFKRTDKETSMAGIWL